MVTTDRGGDIGGAHLEEADAASSRSHFVALNRGALREAREARYWLRLIAATKRAGHERIPALEREAGELVAIITAIVRNASASRTHHVRTDHVPRE
jgi:four helix bundle protein